MSVSASTLRRLAALKLAPEQMAGVLGILAEMAEAEEGRKEAARLKKKRQRASCPGTVPGQERDIDGDIDGDISGTEPGQDGDNLGDAKDARVHVRDITNNLDTPSVSASSSASERDFDWPETWPPSRAYLDQLEALLRETAGAALNSAAPKLAIVATVLSLGRSGKGPRCELQLDVLPAIRACAAKTKPGSVSGWEFFKPAIIEARDRRLSGAPAVAESGSVVPLRPGGFKSREDQNREGWDYAIARIAADE